MKVSSVAWPAHVYRSKAQLGDVMMVVRLSKEKIQHHYMMPMWKVIASQDKGSHGGFQEQVFVLCASLLGLGPDVPADWLGTQSQNTSQAASCPAS